MTIANLIRDLSRYPQDKDIEIECPNGLMVEPKIKRHCDTWADIDKPAKKYVITWDN